MATTERWTNARPYTQAHKIPMATRYVTTLCYMPVLLPKRSSSNTNSKSKSKNITNGNLHFCAFGFGFSWLCVLFCFLWTFSSFLFSFFLSMLFFIVCISLVSYNFPACQTLIPAHIMCIVHTILTILLYSVALSSSYIRLYDYLCYYCAQMWGAVCITMIGSTNTWQESTHILHNRRILTKGQLIELPQIWMWTYACSAMHTHLSSSAENDTNICLMYHVTVAGVVLLSFQPSSVIYIYIKWIKITNNKL